MWRRSQQGFNCGSSSTSLFGSRVVWLSSFEWQVSQIWKWVYKLLLKSLTWKVYMTLPAPFCIRWNKNVMSIRWWCYGVLTLSFLSHPELLSLSWEWTQEVEFSMATTEVWCCLLAVFLVLFHRSPQLHSQLVVTDFNVLSSCLFGYSHQQLNLTYHEKIVFPATKSKLTWLTFVATDRNTILEMLKYILSCVCVCVWEKPCSHIFQPRSLFIGFY